MYPLDYPDFESKGSPNCRKPLPVSVEVFFPDQNKPNTNAISTVAKAVCKGCPYLEECLAWALVNDEPGVWGGTTASERRSMRRRATRRAAPSRYR